MDENFNSLVEEQKEPSAASFTKTKATAGEESDSIEEISGHVEGSEYASIPDVDVSHPSLEKLADLTAVMRRFELDVVAAANLPRTRSNSEPTAVKQTPDEVSVKSDEVNMNRTNTRPNANGSISHSEAFTPPSTNFDEKKRLDSYHSPSMNGSKSSHEDRRGFYRHLQENCHGHIVRTTAADPHSYGGFVWSGELPPRNYSNPTFSSKIFVGGARVQPEMAATEVDLRLRTQTRAEVKENISVPWDITEAALVEAFSPYGACRVEWPSKEVRSPSNMRNRGKATGYVYIVFETERSVKSLLQDCSQEFGPAGEWYFKLKARRNQVSEIRQVQVIPWVVSDSSYIDDPTVRLDPKKTVFVGALHGMITAHVLFSIMNELYGNVVFVGIDTDKHKYPIGSGRVTFRSHTSYFRAIESAYLEIQTSKFTKRVQIDPFLEDSWCMMCSEFPGPYFCRDRTCFRYYCGSCWQARHAIGGSYAEHRPLTRHTPRSMAARAGETNCIRQEQYKSSSRCYLPSRGSVPVTPLGGVAAVAAVAHGTVPRQQHHAYQYMQVGAPYPTAVYTPTLVQPQCRMGSNVAPTPVIGTNQPVNASSPFVHQRLY